MRLRVPVALATAALLAALPLAAEEKPGGVSAVLELRQQFYYAGEAFDLRVNVVNNGDKPVDNPVKSALVKGLVVKNATGVALKPTGKPTAAEPSRPDSLGAKGFYGTVFDLTQMYPEMKAPGRFEIQWTADGLSSNVIGVTVIRAFDPSKDYRAKVDTDEGSFVIDFFGKAAPIATKAFIDLSNAGFFDGLIFHEVRPDWYVAGGDPKGDGTGRAPFVYPAEPSSVPMVAGTVIMKPAGVAPPSNSSQFVVLLRPEPGWSGQFTVVGQVVEGLDVLQKISRLPSSQQATRPYYKPLKDIRMVKVTVNEKQPAPPSP